MQNEKLFKKIKDAVLRDVDDSDDWNPEKVWLKIEKRQNLKLRRLWLSGLAACLILGIGISFILLNGADDQLVVKGIADNTSIVLQQDKLTKSLPGKSRKTPAAKSRSSLEESLPDLLAERNEGGESFSVQENDSVQKYTSFSVLAQAIPTPELPGDAMRNVVKGSSERPSKPEKVLIAEIELPEESVEEAPTLRRMFETAKTERESRKIRVNFGANRKKTALWSFVQHSFTDNSANPDSGFLLKRAY